LNETFSHFVLIKFRLDKPRKTVANGSLSSFFTDPDSESAALVEADEITRVSAAHCHSTVEVDRFQFHVCYQRDTHISDKVLNYIRLYHAVKH